MRWCFLVCFLSFHAHAQEWKAVDYLLLSSATTLLVVDWGQTRSITHDQHQCTRYVDDGKTLGFRKETYNCQRKYSETNHILGDTPSQNEVDRYFTLAILGTAGLSYVLPQTYRRFFLGSVVVLQSYYVYKNHQIGLRVNF